MKALTLHRFPLPASASVIKQMVFKKESLCFMPADSLDISIVDAASGSL